ncbi:MAG: hypothetical protein ACTSR8_19445 [Promethearchaeota archaeon]
MKKSDAIAVDMSGGRENGKKIWFTYISIQKFQKLRVDAAMPNYFYFLSWLKGS